MNVEKEKEKNLELRSDASRAHGSGTENHVIATKKCVSVTQLFRKESRVTRSDVLL